MLRFWNWVNRVPGWLVILIIAGGLYLTGLHTEVIGQAQRLLLATGLRRPQVPEVSQAPPGTAPSSAAAFPLADYDFELQTLEGAPVSLASMKGKVIFLNFWATWCPPCIAEMPNIQNLYEKMPPDKVAFVLVSLDEDPAKARSFISRKGYSFPVYTPRGPIPAAFAGQVLPTTYLISPDGRVVSRQEGMADYDNARFRDFLLQLARQREAF